MRGIEELDRGRVQWSPTYADLRRSPLAWKGDSLPLSRRLGVGDRSLELGRWPCRHRRPWRPMQQSQLGTRAVRSGSLAPWRA